MKALVGVVSELAAMDEPRKHLAGIAPPAWTSTTTSARDIRCWDAACPTWSSKPPTARCGCSSSCTTPARCSSTSATPAGSTSRRGPSGCRLIDAHYGGPWELPVLGEVTAAGAILIRPDGYVAWVGEGTDAGLRVALTTWFGPP